MKLFNNSLVRLCCHAIVAIGVMLAGPAYGDMQPVDSPAGDVSKSAKPATHCGTGGTPGYEDCILYEQLKELGGSLDIGMLTGLAPPPFGTPGEFIELVTNLNLKTYPPVLVAPNDLQVNPRVAAAGAAYTIDGCGIQFELLSAQASYSNLFGIFSLPEPYVQESPFIYRPWLTNLYRDNLDDPNTRWGFLRAPIHLYHANTDVRLEIKTQNSVRKYDQGTGQFGEPYLPINTFATGPQQVYLPIGNHQIEWHATTQLNELLDISIPLTLFSFQVLSDVWAASGGLEAAKVAKKSGITEAAAEQVVSASKKARLRRLTDGFNKVWEYPFSKRRQAKKIKKAARSAIEKWNDTNAGKIKKKVGIKVATVLYKLKTQGYETISNEVIDEIEQKGLEYPVVVTMLRVVNDVLEDRSPSGGSGHKIDNIVELLVDVDVDNLRNISAAVISRAIDEYGPRIVLLFSAVDTAKSVKGQNITVWDTVPPTIDLSPEPIFVEAQDFGGTRLYRVRARLQEIGEAASSDNCGRTPEITVSGPELLPIGMQQITLTARDRGPNPDDGQNYAPTAVQNIIVRDTQPPLLLAPPSKVILDTGDVALDAAKIGDAVTVDLADVQPQVTNDAPGVFRANSRTRVMWTSTDASGNDVEASQLISVKTSNKRPTANGTTESALTAEPVDITLTANDIDVLPLDGKAVFDPLWFKIESQPDHGEFIAPLYPFFIEDYRTRPNDGLGKDFDPETDTATNFVGRNYCNSSSPLFGEPPRNFVHQPLFVHVTDDNIRYVLDEFFVCLQFNGGPTTQRRFSKWNLENEFLGQMQIGSSPSDRPLGDAFRVDRDGFLYFNTLINTGSAKRLDLIKCDTNWTADSKSSECPQSNSFTGNENLSANSLSYARIDSRTDVIYVVANGILAYDRTPDGGGFLGKVGPKDADGVVLNDWFGKVSSLEVGSDGALYANDEEWDRIHKIGPPTVDSEGELVLGEYVGWAGKCSASGYGDCDVDLVTPELGRSFGYSCTYDNGNPTCTVAATAKSACNPDDPGDLKPDARAGCRQGQFDTPKYISIDPNDVLYVADYENGRVQRFSPDGSFAGEAVSEGSGVNKGSRPSFILGNMGNPVSVAVNSSQFFVVDRREKFVYVFGTLPFKDIKESAAPGASMEATVTYVSDQRFPNPSAIGEDYFSFSVTDGLDRSESATVTVLVSRNFRPPQAASITVSTAEDTPVDFELPAGDPDGVIGKDPDGLDTLTFMLTRWPENGTLSGYGESWTYTPSPDFYGEDSLSFKVNDGVDDSNEGTLTFNVTPVNDPPVVTAEAPDRVARGFPMKMQSTFTDDRADENSSTYEALIVWGDGGSDITGEISNDAGDVSTVGIVILAPPPADPDADGYIFAGHTFEQTGEQTIDVCVADGDALQGCDRAIINVESLVVMGIRGIFYDTPLLEGDVTLEEIADGAEFTLEVQAVNSEPAVGVGLPAEEVAIDLLLPASLNISDVTIDQGSCTLTDLEVACAVGALSPGAQVKLTMTIRGPGNLIYNKGLEFDGTMRTSSAALSDEVGLFATVELIADTTDSDGDGMSDTFEDTFGLNPGIDDSAGDEDGDGLSNVDEFNEGTSPLVADTDGDGINDGDEIASGMDPLVDDVPPELIIPADIEINATGLLTLVSLGSATATDFKDGPVEVIAKNPGPFRPGHHVVTWIAFDEAGNKADGYQFVRVVPIVSFQIDQTVSEGVTARARVELNGAAVSYPVVVPFEISGTAVNPDDHNGVSGEAVITSGLSTDIEIAIAKDLNDEPDETIILTMGVPTNAVAGTFASHSITITELNLPPKVGIDVEQQGRRTTTIVSSAGTIGIIAVVRDDLAQTHSFDWSASDSALIEPVAVNDPAYLLEPSGLGAGLYGMGLSVTDDGVPPLNTVARSLLNVANEQLVLRSRDDSDGDGASDAAEGPDDADGDRVANYLDDIANSNMLRLAADGRILETTPGLALRLGATTFARSSAYASLQEQEVALDDEHGYASDLLDVEVTRLDPGGTAHVVVPLARSITSTDLFRNYSNGQWRNFFEDASNTIASAPGERGACPSPANDDYALGLAESNGCVQLKLTDGGPNDSDGLVDGVVRYLGGLATPIAARVVDTSQIDTVLTGDGEAIMVRMRLRSDSGGTVLKSLTVEASGGADDVLIDDVILIHDSNHDGEWDDEDFVLASGKFSVDNGILTLVPNEPIEVPIGDTDLLVVYVFGDVE